MQLPPYFGVDRLSVLERFIERFPAHIPLAIELRHESWFGENQVTEQLWKLMEARRVSTVLSDVAGRRDVLHMRLTTGTAMVRFVGNLLHPTDYERADAWLDRLEKWFAQGLKQVFFFAHQSDDALVPEMAQYILKRASQIPNVQTRGPKLIAEEPPKGQMSLF